MMTKSQILVALVNARGSARGFPRVHSKLVVRTNVDFGSLFNTSHLPFQHPYNDYLRPLLH